MLDIVLTLNCYLQPNNKLVWSETTRIVEDLFQNVWGDQKMIKYDNTLEITVAVCPSIWCSSKLSDYLSLSQLCSSLLPLGSVVVLVGKENQSHPLATNLHSRSAHSIAYPYRVSAHRMHYRMHLQALLSMPSSRLRFLHGPCLGLNEHEPLNSHTTSWRQVEHFYTVSRVLRDAIGPFGSFT